MHHISLLFAKDGYTALMCAVGNESISITQLLLQHGANVDAINNVPSLSQPTSSYKSYHLYVER